MFRTMRREKQQLTMDEAMDILNKGQTGILAVEGDEGYPYAVPLNYVYQGNSIFFHCGKKGHKTDGILKNPKVSFCVVGEDKVAAERFSTDYRSVIAFGRAEIIEEDEKRVYALKALIEKYSRGYEEQGEKEIEKFWNQVDIVEIQIEHVTGKRNMIGN